MSISDIIILYDSMVGVKIDVDQYQLRIFSFILDKLWSSFVPETLCQVKNCFGNAVVLCGNCRKQVCSELCLGQHDCPDKKLV